MEMSKSKITRMVKRVERGDYDFAKIEKEQAQAIYDILNLYCPSSAERFADDWSIYHDTMGVENA